MTTIVTATAHCGPTKEVHVTVSNTEGNIQAECEVLQEGESASKAVYDDRTVSFTEVTK